MANWFGYILRLLSFLKKQSGQTNPYLQLLHSNSLRYVTCMRTRAELDKDCFQVGCHSGTEYDAFITISSCEYRLPLVKTEPAKKTSSRSCLVIKSDWKENRYIDLKFKQWDVQLLQPCYIGQSRRPDCIVEHEDWVLPPYLDESRQQHPRSERF